MNRRADVEPERDAERDERRADRRLAAAGGVAAAITGFGGMALVGSVSGTEARRLLDAMLPSARFAASSFVAGGATILALMLTLITFSISHELDFRESHYRRIREISMLTTAVIVGSVLLLMFLSVPIGEADVDRDWYRWVYYALLLGGSLTGGTFIALILMLFYAIGGLVDVGEDPEASTVVIPVEETDGDEAHPVST